MRERELEGVRATRERGRDSLGAGETHGRPVTVMLRYGQTHSLLFNSIFSVHICNETSLDWCMQ